MLEFTYHRKTLLSALKLALKVIPKRVVQPILASVELTETQVRATNLDTWLTQTLTHPITVSGSIVTPAKRLADLLNGLSDDFVTIHQSDDHTTTLAGFTLESEPAENYPTFPSFNDSHMAADISSVQLSTALKQLTFAAADYYDSHSILGGIHISGDSMCATDGSRMSWVTLDNVDLPESIIPVSELAGVMPLFKMAQPLKYRVNDQYASFAGRDFTLIIRKIAGQYPRYQELFPARNGTHFSVNRKELLSALKLLKPTVDKNTNLVMFNFQDKTLTNRKDTVSLNLAVYPADLKPIALNFHYLTDWIESLDGDDFHVHTQIDNSKHTDRQTGRQVENTCNLKPLQTEQNGYRHLLMPVQAK